MYITLWSYMTVFFNIFFLVHQLSSSIQARIILAMFVFLSLIGCLLYFLVNGVLFVAHKELEDEEDPDISSRPDQTFFSIFFHWVLYFLGCQSLYYELSIWTIILKKYHVNKNQCSIRNMRMNRLFDSKVARNWTIKMKWSTIIEQFKNKSSKLLFLKKNWNVMKNEWNRGIVRSIQSQNNAINE